MNSKQQNTKTKSKNPELKKEMKRPPKWFYLILVLLPILFILLLEAFLRIINYGDSYKEFVTLTKDFPNELILNPDITTKYFNNLNNFPVPTPDAFTRIKEKNTYRIFILGGSSAQGWPYESAASFSSNLKRRLELIYPEKHIEVINCGISAINTYSIRDFLPGILEQKPDLILIYAGHNEYYGALGPGSSVSMGKSRFLINTYIALEDFRTTQLLRNIIQKIWSLFSTEDKSGKDNNETLMGRVIGESAIPLNSESYYLGISQFKGNMDDILKLCRKKNVPVIIGNLTCNLKDLEPFVSVKTENLPTADSIYDNAKVELRNSNINKARKLFSYARDLDALRFRAPSEINKIIMELAKKYNYPLLNIDSVFESYSPDRIVGYNLTVDHLHPNIEGYKLMGKAYFQEMEKLNLLPEGKRINIPTTKQDSILNAQFPFTRLDSTVSRIKIATLTGAYPFKPKDTPNYKLDTLKFDNYIDSLAVKYVHRQIGWQNVHVEASDWYYNKKNYSSFIKELEPLIDLFPFDTAPYEYITRKLLDAKKFDLVLPFLYKYYEMKPNFIAARWIGTINLNIQNLKEALKYLRIASEYKEAGPVLFYNLAGAYYYNKEYKNALTSVDKSIQLSPSYSAAKEFKTQLLNFLKSNGIKY
jgi:lysophospholipase L1-like esterase